MFDIKIDYSVGEGVFNQPIDCFRVAEKVTERIDVWNYDIIWSKGTIGVYGRSIFISDFNFIGQDIVSESVFDVFL